MQNKGSSKTNILCLERNKEKDKLSTVTPEVIESRTTKRIELASVYYPIGLILSAHLSG